MAGERDFERRLEIIERGVREIEQANDPGLRATAQQVIQAILELHGRSIERLLEIVDSAGDASPGVVDRLGRDPLVSSLLLLHALHPHTLEERVHRALDAVQPSLHASRGAVIDVHVTESAVTVRIRGGPEQQAAVERAIADAAPDASVIDVVRDAEPVVGFVPLSSLRREAPAVRAQHG